MREEILIGRAITERPDLFAAAQIAVGCTDMMRFETTMNAHRMSQNTGTLSIPEEFRSLFGDEYVPSIIMMGRNIPP